jgi:S-adenosylmethionine synthetase
VKKGRHLFTSESVSMGHPDKMADQISDAVLDAILAKDPYGRVAVETLLTTGVCIVAGEVTTNCYVEVPEIARATIKEIGYTDADMGFDYKTCAVLTAIHKQSTDIDMGVSKGKEIGAGDQGLMFGFACDETPELMPLPIMLAHRLLERLAQIRFEGDLTYLRPDAKSQVTVEYEGDRPVRVHTVVISTQHHPDVKQKTIREDMEERVIDEVIPAALLDKDVIIHVNPTGRFVHGGPAADTGLTGRKIIVDTYGGMGRHGGGAFSGKDPTKVDRSASYAARHVAKNIVAGGLAKRAEVQLAYAIGVAEPLSIRVDTFGTGAVPDGRIAELVREHFRLTPRGIIETLDLRRPIYKETARHGHFGRAGAHFTWEGTDRAEALRKAAGLGTAAKKTRAGRAC